MADMIRKTITIPDTMADFISARLQSGLFANDSEYFRELVRQDQRHAELKDQSTAFQAMIEQSIASGFTEESFDDIVRAARAKVKNRS
ncbi:MAG: type II toxin-antitoxin system ParD family antitoxin [Pseudomonadota bacterium]